MRKRTNPFLELEDPTTTNAATNNIMGGSPGLVVMGEDSRSEGRGFKSWRHILDGHDIFHINLL